MSNFKITASVTGYKISRRDGAKFDMDYEGQNALWTEVQSHLEAQKICALLNAGIQLIEE